MNPPANLGGKARRAIGWSAIAQVVVFTTQFALNIVLARLLLPADFGLVAMVVAFTGFASLFVDMGLGPALVQLETLEPRHESTVFWMQLGSSVLLSALTCALAPVLGWFYDDPRVIPLALGISPLFVLISLGVVHLQLQHRRVQFKRVSIIEMTSALIAGAGAIALAVFGAGVWALVARPLILAGTRSVALWVTSSWRPKLLFDRAAAREVIGFGSGFTGTLIINYWTKRAGDVIVGRSLGTTELGYYNRAFALMLQPVSQVTRVIMRVMFPVLSRIQKDTSKVRESYLRTITFIAMLTFPACLGLVALAEPFVGGLLGREWLPMVPMLQLFCIAGMINSVDNTAMHLFLIRGNADKIFRWRTMTALVTLSGFFIGAQWGGVGVAAAYLTSTVILMPFNFSVPGKEFDIDVFVAGRVVGKVLVAAVIMAAIVFALDHALPGGRLSHLAVLTPLGAAIYVVLLLVLRVPELKEAWGIVRRRKRTT